MQHHLSHLHHPQASSAAKPQPIALTCQHHHCIGQNNTAFFPFFPDPCIIDAPSIPGTPHLQRPKHFTAPFHLTATVKSFMSRRAKTSDAKAKQTEAEAPPCPYEKILSCRKSESGPPEYLVKLRGKAYRESKWLRGDQLEAYPQAQALVTRFNKNSSSFPTEEPFYDPSFDVVDRIIGKKKNKFKVKWMNLGYNDMTLETNLPESAIDEYKKRAKQTFPGMEENVKAPIKLQKRILEEYAIGNERLQGHQLTALNLLLSNYVDGVASEIVDQYSMDMYVSCCSLLQMLIVEGNEVGPFLIVAPNATAQRWYNLVRQIQNITALAFFGSSEGRQIALDEDFYGRGQRLKFHILVTTPDILGRDIEAIGEVKWRLAIYDDASRLKNPQSKLFKLVQRLEVGQQVALSQPSVNFGDLSKLVELMTTKDGQETLPQEVVEEAEAVKARVQTRRAKRKGLPEEFLSYFIDCPLNMVQKRIMKETLMNSGRQIRKGDFITVCRRILKVCTHPFLTFGVEHDLKSVNYLAASTKLAVLDVLLKESFEWQETVLIVSQFSLMLDLAEDVANAHDLTFERILDPKFVDMDNTTATVFMYNPLFCEFASTILDKIDTIIVIDSDPADFMREVRSSRSPRLSKIYHLHCRDCSESILNQACIINPRRTLDQLKCEDICRLTALAALSDIHPPSPDVLVKTATVVRRTSNPNESLGEELSNCDFWSFIVKPEDKKETDHADDIHTELGHQDMDHTWTLRERDQLLRALTHYGWNRWNEITIDSGLTINKACLIRASRALLRELVRISQSPTGHQIAKNYVREAEVGDNDDDTDREFMEHTCFGEKNFKLYLQKNVSLLLRKIESLFYIKDCYRDDVREVQLLRSTPGGPADWWDEHHDRLLLYYTWNCGLGCYERFYDDGNHEIMEIFGQEDDYVMHRDLTDRVFRLAESVKRGRAPEPKREAETEKEAPSKPAKPKSDKKALPADDDDYDQVRPGGKFNKNEESLALQHLLKHGIEEDKDGMYDYEAFAENSGLSRTRTAAEVQLYLENMLKRCEIPPEEGGLRSNTALRVNQRFSAMRQVRAIIRSEDLARKVIEKQKWRCMPASWTSDLELLYLKEVSERGFGSYDDILKMPEFENVFTDPEDKRGFICKDGPVMKRIGTIFDHINAARKTANRVKSTSRPKKEPLAKKPEPEPDAPKDTPEQSDTIPTADQVTRDRVKYPIQLGDNCAVNFLGLVEYERPAYHTERQIYPIGFKVTRPFVSLEDPTQDEPWTAEIRDGGDAPEFVIWPTRDSSRVFSGTTPSAPWSKVADELQIKRQINGLDLFLLSNDDVTFCIQHLKFVSRCKGYITRPVPREKQETKRREKKKANQKEAAQRRMRAVKIDSDS